MNVTQWMQLVEMIVMIGIVISSAELLRVRSVMEDDALLSWRIQQLYHPRLASVIRKSYLHPLFRYPAFLSVLVARILIALSIPIVVYLNGSTFIPLCMLVLTSILCTIRNPQSNDGSDQMAALIVISCALGEGFPSPLAKHMALLFIALQSAMAYTTSGALKLTKKGWLNGHYPIAILKTSSFGNRHLLILLEKKIALAKITGGLVAMGDLVIGLSFLYPPVICLCVLTFGICLHLGIAYVMGLNNFLWSFGATYPALYYCSVLIYGISS